jgi:glycine dehydrogenase subunit 1
MANAVPEIKAEMLRAIGVEDVEDLFEQIPADHRIAGDIDLPDPILSEVELKRHLVGMLSKNRSCEENLSFLGGGCWQHYVPAVCDEIVGRAEFLTPVWGTPSSDHGRNQAWFEYASQLGELVEMDVVSMPCYSWGCAAGHAVRMAARITGRREALVPRASDPERLSVLRSFCEPPEMASHIAVTLVDYDPWTGLLDLEDLERKISAKTAAVYFDNPSYLGFIETQGAEIARIARAHGAETIVGADPISLGVLAPPATYGADITVGPTQPLGVHMSCGGGCGGFIASRDEVRYIGEYPTFLVSITGTSTAGEHGFGLSSAHQTSYGMREEGKDWTGNSVYLWAIANAVYMSLLGPAGFRELGALIVERASYAANLLSGIEGVALAFTSPCFKEFTLDFSGTGKSVREINEGLRARAIFGGADLSRAFPELGQSALYCVTEIHRQADIERLAEALGEVLGR